MWSCSFQSTIPSLFSHQKAARDSCIVYASLKGNMKRWLAEQIVTDKIWNHIKNTIGKIYFSTNICILLFAQISREANNEDCTCILNTSSWKSHWWYLRCLHGKIQAYNFSCFYQGVRPIWCRLKPRLLQIALNLFL